MKVKKALIPIAGFGTRLLPASKSVPKEMFPVVNQPAIFYILKEIMDAGIQTAVFVQGRGKTAIEDFFDTSYELESYLRSKNQIQTLQSIQEIQDKVHIFSIRQQKPLGLGHAISCAENLLKDEPFTVLLPDEIIIGPPNPTETLISQFESHHISLVGLMTVSQDDVEKYGIATLNQDPLSSDIHQVTSIIEKPNKGKAPSLLSCCGRYVFTPSIFKYLKKDILQEQKMELTDAMNQLATKNELLAVHFSTQQRYDIGSPWGLLHANIQLGLQHPDIAPYLKKYISYLKNTF